MQPAAVGATPQAPRLRLVEQNRGEFGVPKASTRLKASTRSTWTGSWPVPARRGSCPTRVLLTRTTSSTSDSIVRVVGGSISPDCTSELPCRDRFVRRPSVATKLPQRMRSPDSEMVHSSMSTSVSELLGIAGGGERVPGPLPQLARSPLRGGAPGDIPIRRIGMGTETTENEDQ